VALCRTDGPTALVLTRQNLPVLEVAETAGALQGGYVLRDPAGGPPEVILMGTGSEVHIALAAQALLADQGVLARVVSLPCWELFAAQPQAYRDSVLPPDITARVAIEAGVTFGWERWLGPAGVAIGLNHFGASAPYETLYAKFGLTPEAVAAAARQLRR
jgi:transketolase